MQAYLLLAGLAMGKRWRLLAAAAVPAFAFSLYLAHVEKDILETWCIYCVISLAMITLITLLSLIALIMDWRRRRAIAREHGITSRPKRIWKSDSGPRERDECILHLLPDGGAGIDDFKVPSVLKRDELNVFAGFFLFCGV